MENLVKALHGIFKRHDLTIKVSHSDPKVNFLDLTLNLAEGTYEPYRKEGNVPLYINKKSNHPPSIIKALPKMIMKMWSSNCSNEEIFNRHKKGISEPLEKSGYDASGWH